MESAGTELCGCGRHNCSDLLDPCWPAMRSGVPSGTLVQELLIDAVAT